MSVQLRVPSVKADIYNWDVRYRSVLRRLHAEDSGMLEGNRLDIKKFLERGKAGGLSLPRVIKYGNHLITFARCCSKPFEEMTQDDVRDALVSLKNGSKMDPRFSKRRNSDFRHTNGRYSEVTIDGFKIMLKIFWRWLKGMDESKPVYPCEVAQDNSSVERSGKKDTDKLAPPVADWQTKCLTLRSSLGRLDNTDR
ncbi:MAG: hypothetical protein JRN52_06550 [Nitrososphaerota archaeon]|nr:hypothetical protein [Nitrososphaerota archaeon]